MYVYNENNFLINEDTNNYLETIIKSKVLANGYIFYGAEGLGKREAAFEFTKKIFKQYHQSGNVENRIINNNHPDLLIVEPSSILHGKKRPNLDNKILKTNFETIKIDQIRNIKTFLSQKSIESEKKIILIIDAHLLNEASSNCLLKTLEEPSNGIFILLTSKLNSLLDTVKSRCQIIQFKSFSKIEIDLFLKNNVEPDILENIFGLTIQDLVNSSNGSPKKILNNIEIWKQLSAEIKKKLELPLKDKIEIFKVSKTISEDLEVYQQIVLIQLIQQSWWRKTRNKNIIKILENLKFLIKQNCQPRLSWEVNLLKIALEDF